MVREEEEADERNKDIDCHVPYASAPHQKRQETSDTKLLSYEQLL